MGATEGAVRHSGLRKLLAQQRTRTPSPRQQSSCCQGTHCPGCAHPPGGQIPVQQTAGSPTRARLTHSLSGGVWSSPRLSHELTRPAPPAMTWGCSMHSPLSKHSHPEHLPLHAPACPPPPAQGQPCVHTIIESTGTPFALLTQWFFSQKPARGNTPLGPFSPSPGFWPSGGVCSDPSYT